MSSVGNRVTVVMVHGAWADGSSWSKVIGPLQDAGLNAVCAPIPLTRLNDDVDMVASIVERAPGPVVLVGHAYAGAVIGSVRNDKVKALVFVAALAPDTGETVADVFYRNEKHPDAPEMAPDQRGFIWMPDAGSKRHLHRMRVSPRRRLMQRCSGHYPWNASRRPLRNPHGSRHRAGICWRRTTG
jgi:pimeloyl-ACP methyl ester carboxylesterase